ALGTGTATTTISGGFGIGVGTTTPGAAFAVATSTAGLNTAMLLSNLGSGYTFWAQDEANDTSPFVIDNAGNVGIGTTGPGAPLDVRRSSSGAVAEVLRLYNPNVAAGTGARLSFMTTDAVFSAIDGDRFSGDSGGRLFFHTMDTGGTLRERVRIDSSGNVGIGSTNPQQVLTVIGNGLFSGDLALNGNDINLGTGTATTTISGGFGIGIGTTTPGAAFAVATSTAGLNTAMLLSNLGSGYTFWAQDEANDTSPFVIQADGNVGIGKAGPGAKLHVEGATGVNIENFSNDPGTTALLNFQSANLASASITYARINSSLVIRTTGSEDGSLIFSTMRAGTLTEAARILSSGNVGIGTTNPQQVLTVIGNGLFSGDLALNGNDINLGTGTATTTISGGFGIGVGTTTPGAAFAVATSTAGLNTAMLLSNLGSGYTFWAQDEANDTTPFVIDAGGNLGIGTSTPGTKVGITGLGTGTNKTFVVADSSNTTRFVIQDDGNVGIGTTAPGTKLTLGSGQFSFPSGTESLPSLTSTGDEDTGIYMAGSGQVNITSDGTQTGQFSGAGTLSLTNTGARLIFHNDVTFTRTGTGMLNISGG
ncbi:MAG: hypothetical protein Q8R13_01145, partial [bacterium]|nr:hypothetical protein [bacterium]